MSRHFAVWPVTTLRADRASVQGHSIIARALNLVAHGRIRSNGLAVAGHAANAALCGIRRA